MHIFVARRLVLAVPTLIGATVLVFIIMRILPGDVAELILMGETGGGAAYPWSVEQLREELGLNRPLYVQYFSWLGNILRGDMGKSLWTGRSVAGEIVQRLPVTLQIALMAEMLALLTGIPLGIFSAIRQDTWGDYVSRVFSITFLAIPSFWLGIVVLLVGVRMFNWMPPVGYHALWEDPMGNVSQLIFPAAVLASHEMARLARMTRSSMLEVLREDYIRTARAKGLGELVVLSRHALKNALIPIITFTSVYFGALLGGVVVLESIFTVPGLGTLFLESLRVRDYTIVQAMVLFMAAVFITINLTVDLLYGWMDPRISYA